MKHCNVGLNPFLIRALVLSTQKKETRLLSVRLNPFLIRALVLRFRTRVKNEVKGLNPFLIRALVLSKKTKVVDAKQLS